MQEEGFQYNKGDYSCKTHQYFTTKKGNMDRHMERKHLKYLKENGYLKEKGKEEDDMDVDNSGEDTESSDDGEDTKSNADGKDTRSSADGEDTRKNSGKGELIEDSDSSEDYDKLNSDVDDEIDTWQYVMKKWCKGKPHLMDDYKGDTSVPHFKDDKGEKYQYNFEKVMLEVHRKWKMAVQFADKLEHTSWGELTKTTAKELTKKHDMPQDEAEDAAWSTRKHHFEKKIMPYLYSAEKEVDTDTDEDKKESEDSDSDDKEESEKDSDDDDKEKGSNDEEDDKEDDSSEPEEDSTNRRRQKKKRDGRKRKDVPVNDKKVSYDDNPFKFFQNQLKPQEQNGVPLIITSKAAHNPFTTRR